MRLKEKSSLLAAFLLTLLFLTGCVNEPGTEGNAPINDSLRMAQQKKQADSLKKNNPLLIMPPDSNYTGTYLDKYDNGIVKFRGFYRFGERHGQWMSFYPNGIAWSELHYDKGQRHGPNITYFTNGKVRYSGIYKLDRRDSIWVYFDSTGKLAERVLFQDDRMVKKLGVAQ